MKTLTYWYIYKIKNGGYSSDTSVSYLLMEQGRPFPVELSLFAIHPVVF